MKNDAHELHAVDSLKGGITNIAEDQRNVQTLQYFKITLTF